MSVWTTLTVMLTCILRQRQQTRRQHLQTSATTTSSLEVKSRLCTGDGYRFHYVFDGMTVGAVANRTAEVSMKTVRTASNI